MKKFISILLATITLSLVLSSCSSQKEKVIINSPKDLEEKKIAVQSGTTGETWALEELKIEQKNLSSFKSAIDAVLDLKNGSVDAVILDSLPAKELVSKNEGLKILDFTLTEEEYSIAMKKDNSELLENVNKTITRIKEDGTYEALLNRFMPVAGEIDVSEITKPINIPNAPVLKMGTSADFPPFEYIESSSVVGFDISIAEEIAKDLGYNLQIENMSFDSLVSALQSNQIDLVLAGMSVTEERQKNVLFSDPYYTSSQVVIVKN